MTLQELFARAEAQPWVALAYFGLPPALAWLAGRMHPRGRVADSPLRYVYMVLLYMVCLPGILAAVALADRLAQGQLMQAGLLSEVLPVLSMLVTLGLVRGQAPPEQIPGFRRIAGFVWLLALSGTAVYLLTKTHIWIVFGGGFGTLLVALGVLFLLLRWAFERTFGAGGR
jgi:hypothetical protein